MNDTEIIHDIIYNFLHSFDNTTLQISKNNKNFMAVDDQKNKENNGSLSPSTLSQNKNSSSKLLKDLEYILNEIKNNSLNKKIEKQEIRNIFFFFWGGGGMPPGLQKIQRVKENYLYEVSTLPISFVRHTCNFFKLAYNRNF